jgi:hypothetical protein
MHVAGYGPRVLGLAGRYGEAAYLRELFLAGRSH